MDKCSFAGQLHAIARIVERKAARRETARASAQKARDTVRARQNNRAEERVSVLLADGREHLAADLMARTRLSRGTFYRVLGEMIRAGTALRLGAHRPYRYRRGDRHD